MTLPTDPKDRKQRPIYSGVLKYFPDALAEVAYCSFRGNEQHNPGEPLHWAKEKSTDEHDALIRHALEAGTLDSDGIRHSAKVAWRALAALQRELEAEHAAPKQQNAQASLLRFCAVCHRPRAEGERRCSDPLCRATGLILGDLHGRTEYGT